MNILLICSAGMSTSMVVKKMQEAAAERNLEATVWAVGAAESKTEIPKADVVMLGPQVRYMLAATQKDAGDTPVVTIDMAAYGRMDGSAVLDQAIETLNK